METGAETAFLIIGAGPTGLGAAYRLSELGEKDFLVLERGPRAGGLASSYVDAQGFTWDVGGHVLFSHYPYFDQAMSKALGPDGWLHHQREAWVWMRGDFVPYPFQNNIHRLPAKERDECLAGLENRPTGGRPTDFADWIRQSFGEGIARHFMLPYNFKVWSWPPEEMSYQWIGERVATVDLPRIRQNIALSRDDVSWGPNNRFQFPKQGGTGAIWEGIARLAGPERFRYGKALKRVLPADRTVELEDGTRLRYRHLLSTMPLDLLAPRVEGLAPALVARARELKHSSTHVVGVGLKGRVPEKLRTKCWMYFPEDDCPFYRATVFSNYSPMNVPQEGGPYWSLMTETSSSPKRPQELGRLEERVLDGLVATRLISEADRRDMVVSVWSFSTGHGYPTPSLGRDGILGEVVPALEALGVHTRGRFGGWKYEVSNQDHSFMQGAEWAERMVKGVPETTYRIEK